MKTLAIMTAFVALIITSPVWAPIYCLVKGTSLKKACADAERV